MKKLNFVLLAGILAASSLSASAQLISYVSSVAGGTMPGSPTDFTFVGTSSPLASNNDADSHDVYQGTTDLTDFTAYVGPDTSGMFSDEGTYASYYSTISAPVGYTGTANAPSTLQTGVLFGTGNSGTNLAEFVLGNTSYNYSDFYVYVMYSNYTNPGDDTDIDLTLINSSGTTTLASLVSPANDDQTSTSSARFDLFHVTGGISGDILEVGAAAANGNNALIGGVSFVQSVPEPSTWAMLLGSGALVLAIRRFRKIA